MTTYITIPTSGQSPYWGDSVGTASALPASGNTTGEIVFVQDTSKFYEWTGAAWAVLIDASADVTGPASATANGIARFNGTTGKVIKDSSATLADTGEITSASLTASRAMVSGSSKEIQTSSTTATELGYVSGVTSAIQTQINAKEPSITILPISKGGTNSGTILNSGRAMISTAGAIVESSTTSAEIGFVSGVTSAIQTQITAKAAGAASSTDTAFARFSGTGGKTLQNSGVTCDGSNNVTGIGTLGTSGTITAGANLQLTGAAKMGASGAPATSAVLELNSTTGAFLMPRMTSTQRDALTAVNGMMLYNSSTDRPQCYVAGAWVDMIGWGS